MICGLASARFGVLSTATEQLDDADAMTFTDVAVVLLGFVLPTGCLGFLVTWQVRQQAWAHATRATSWIGGSIMKRTASAVPSSTGVVAADALVDSTGTALFPVTSKVAPTK